VPSGLWEACWKGAVRAGSVDTAGYDGPFVDCGTPARYLAANRWAASEAVGDGSIVHPTAVLAPGAVVEGSIVGPGAQVDGTVRRSVIWAATTVRRAEVLDHAIRAGPRTTVLVR